MAQASSSPEQLTESLGKKVEAFLRGLSPDELRVFVASLGNSPAPPQGEDTRGFLSFQQISAIQPKVGPSLPFCAWGGVAGRPNEICWICGTKVMYCQPFG